MSITALNPLPDPSPCYFHRVMSNTSMISSFDSTANNAHPHSKDRGHCSASPRHSPCMVRKRYTDSSSDTGCKRFDQVYMYSSQ